MRKAVLLIFVASFLVGIASAADTTEPTIDFTVSVDDDSALIEGTAADTSNDENVTAGVQRVEIRIDDNSWVSVTGTTEWSYTVQDLEDGYHTVSARSIDKSNNPSETRIKSFQVDYVDVTENDLSWYINIEDFSFRTLSDINVRQVEEGEDIGIYFDIENECDTDRRLKYTISIGTAEIEDNVVVFAGKSYEVEEWVVSSIFKMGENMVDVELVDKDTMEKVADKTYTVTIVEKQPETDSQPDVTTGDNSVPQWFVTWAKANGMPVEEEDKQLSEMQTSLQSIDERLTEIEKDYSELDGEVSGLQVASNQAAGQQAQTSRTSQIITGIDNWVLLVAAAILAYLFRERLGLVKPEEQGWDYPDDAGMEKISNLPAPEETQDG